MSDLFLSVLSPWDADPYPFVFQRFSIPIGIVTPVSQEPLRLSRVVPRALSVLGLIGGPLIVVSGVLVVLGLVPAGGFVQIIATVPEFFWELLLGLWLVIRGMTLRSLSM